MVDRLRLAGYLNALVRYPAPRNLQPKRRYVTTTCTGYLHELYAASLIQIGVPRQLERSGAWILQRAIQHSHRVDAMGIYPMALCRDWSGLAADLDEIGDEVVCMGMVTDPFGCYDTAYLHRCFSDLVLTFKEHYVVDLRRRPDEIVSPHHRHKVRKANRSVHVELCPYPLDHLQEWIDLYQILVERHHMRGPLVFSREAMAAQLSVPGLVMLRAIQDDETVGIQTWYITGEIVYGHLAAYNQRGYAASASYALYWVAIQHFAGLGLRYIDLGGSPGTGSLR